jgi:hypothetical protein
MSLKGKITIVVNTCDAYSDLWPLFAASFAEFWPHRSLNLVLNTELTTDLGFNGFDALIHNSDSPFWGERLIQTLDDISTEYVLMLYDDFIIEDFFNESVLCQITDAMDDDDSISVFYLDLLGLSSYKSDTHLDGFALISPSADYRLNSAPGVWRKKDLRLFTGKRDSPWAWEVFGTYKTQRYAKHFFQPTQNKFYSFNGAQGGAIYRGKWVEDVVVDKAKKYKLNIDFSKRGFASTTEFEKRPLSWKLNFVWTGFRMVGFDVFKFIFSAIQHKLQRR